MSDAVEDYNKGISAAMLESRAGEANVMKNDAIIKRQDSQILGRSFELKQNALIVRGKPTENDYEEAFRRLSLYDGASSWWWGDLAANRERDYGSLKELAIKYDKKYSSIHNYQTVAMAYKVDMRMSTLTFNHHQIASPEEDRLDWLNKADELENKILNKFLVGERIFGEPK